MRATSTGLLSRLTSRPELLLMFAAALVLRGLLASQFGFPFDLDLFQRWASRLAEVGPGAFYDTGGRPVDYPPGYLYVFWLLGEISSPPAYELLKAPTILADLGLAWIAGTFAARLAPASLQGRWRVDSLVMAAVLFNPAILFAGPLWGQVDALPAFFALASLLLLFTGKPGARAEVAALLLYAVAVAMKPQAGFVLPVILYALYRRRVHGRGAREAISGILAIVGAGVLAFGAWALSGLPFGLGPIALVEFYKAAADDHSFTSANAFNLWGAFGFWRDDLRGDDVVDLFGIPALRIGMLLFVAGTCLVLRRTHTAIGHGADEAVALALAAATVALLAYVVLTRMHERYVFTALVLFAPLIFIRPLRWVYATLSALFFLNLWFAYAHNNGPANTIRGLYIDPLFTWLFGSTEADDTWQNTAWSLAVVAVMLVVVARGPRWVESGRSGPP